MSIQIQCSKCNKSFIAQGGTSICNTCMPKTEMIPCPDCKTLYPSNIISQSWAINGGTCGHCANRKTQPDYKSMPLKGSAKVASQLTRVNRRLVKRIDELDARIYKLEETVKKMSSIIAGLTVIKL